MAHSDLRPKQLEQIVGLSNEDGKLVCGSGDDSMEEIDVCSLDENYVETDIPLVKRFTSSFSIEQLLNPIRVGGGSSGPGSLGAPFSTPLGSKLCTYTF